MLGKSLVTSLLAARASKFGYRTAVLDADITGPSIPKYFGVSERATGEENAIFPVETEEGIQLMSMNCLLEHDEDPVVWRGALIAGAATQFWTDVIWDDVDIMFIDIAPRHGRRAALGVPKHSRQRDRGRDDAAGSGRNDREKSR